MSANNHLILPSAPPLMILHGDRSSSSLHSASAVTLPPQETSSRHAPPGESLKAAGTPVPVGLRLGDDELELAALGVEGPELAVRPAAHDGGPVRGHLDARAIEARDLPNRTQREATTARAAGLGLAPKGDLDPQDLLLEAQVPDADVILGAGDEEVGAAAGEAHVVHRPVVARAPQLRLELRADVVPRGLVRSCPGMIHHGA
jgi:hypothetical protein